MSYFKPSSARAPAIFGHVIIFIMMSENGQRGAKSGSCWRNENDKREADYLFIQNHEVSRRPPEIGRERPGISRDPVGERRSETSPPRTAGGRQKPSGAS